MLIAKKCVATVRQVNTAITSKVSQNNKMENTLGAMQKVLMLNIH